jgi:hypothetical protein
VLTENSVPINQHPCGTLIADLLMHFPCWQVHRSLNAGSLCLVRSSSASRGAQGVLVAKESGFDQQKFGRVDQGEASFPLRKANIDATDLLRLSGASLILVV